MNLPRQARDEHKQEKEERFLAGNCRLCRSPGAPRRARDWRQRLWFQVSSTPLSPQIPDEKTRSFAKTGSGQTQKRRSVFHSGMEFEAVCRYQMPLITIIINNNGIGSFNPGAKNAPSLLVSRFPPPKTTISFIKTGSGQT
jgi:hypothetical protein